MKAALVLEGGPFYPDRDKLKTHGITRLYYEARDPALTQKVLDDIRKILGLTDGVGIMRDPSWDDSKAAELASKLSKDLETFASPSRGPGLKQCAALADIELHDSQYVLDFLAAWRDPKVANRPSRETAWTLEPFQAIGFPNGWLSPVLVVACMSDVNLQVIHQNYLGTPRMYPAAADIVRDDLLGAGFQRGRLHGFYDGEQPLPDRWDGIVYDFNKLP